ncbi:MAG: hypothetical protein AAF985_21830, partial [Bacteroidota bacterium]
MSFRQQLYQIKKKGRLQLGAYFHSFQKDRTLGKFVIFGQGRTGSTLLVDLLNSHPTIACEQEIFSRRYHLLSGKLRWPYRFLQGMEARHAHQTFGFKVKIYQLTLHQHLDPMDFLDRLEQRGYQIIYLRRDNFLEHAISGLSAQQTKRFHLFKGELNEYPPIELSVADLEEALENRRMYQEQELSY